MFWTHRLHIKLVVIVLVISVICVIISISFSIKETNQIVEEQRNIYGVALSSILATFCIEDLIAWDYPSLQLSAEHIARHDPDILAIKIYHHDKMVANYEKNSKEKGIEYKTPIAVTVRGEENLLGLANIIISTKKFHAFFMQQLYSLIILGLILGFGDTFLIYLSTRMIIVNPIKRVEKGAEIIGKGNFDYRIDIQSDDEIGMLAKALNTMSKNLKLSNDETKNYKRHLEKRVNELEKFHELTVDRELRMVELKEKIKKLEKQPIKKNTKEFN